MAKPIPFAKLIAMGFVALVGLTGLYWWVSFGWPAPYVVANLGNQCAHWPTEDMFSFFRPAEDDATDAKRKLPEYLESQRQYDGDQIPDLANYEAEFIGFTTRNARYLYGSYRPRGQSAAEGCDGGRHYFHVVFSLTSKRFVSVHFHGVA